MSNTLEPIAFDTAISPNPSLATRIELRASYKQIIKKNSNLKTVQGFYLQLIPGMNATAFLWHYFFQNNVSKHASRV